MNTPMNAKDWINHLDLRRHPEGGYYKEVFRSEKQIDNHKSAMTSIYYLLEDNDTFEALEAIYPQHKELLARLCQ